MGNMLMGRKVINKSGKRDYQLFAASNASKMNFFT